MSYSTQKYMLKQFQLEKICWAEHSLDSKIWQFMYSLQGEYNNLS